jgi:hypothetical protein
VEEEHRRAGGGALLRDVEGDAVDFRAPVPHLAACVDGLHAWVDRAQCSASRPLSSTRVLSLFVKKKKRLILLQIKSLTRASSQRARSSALSMSFFYARFSMLIIPNK